MQASALEPHRLEYVPVTHGTHGCPGVGLLVPGAHAVHTNGDAPPVVALYVPAAHDVHAAEVSAEIVVRYVPGTQAVQPPAYALSL